MEKNISIGALYFYCWSWRDRAEPIDWPLAVDYELSTVILSVLLCKLY